MCLYYLCTSEFTGLILISSVVLLMFFRAKETIFFFPGSGSGLGLHVAFHFQVALFSFSLQQFSSLLYLSWPWHFWRVQAIYLVAHPLLGLVWCFFIVKFRLYIFWQKYTEVMPCLFQPVIFFWLCNIMCINAFFSRQRD